MDRVLEKILRISSIILEGHFKNLFFFFSWKECETNGTSCLRPQTNKQFFGIIHAKPFDSCHIYVYMDVALINPCSPFFQ